MSRIRSLGVPILVMLVLSHLSLLHLCDLNSLWLQLPMMGVSVVLLPLWIHRSSRPGQRMVRWLVSVVAALSLQVGYVFWVHSDTFPQWLLTSRPRRLRVGGADVSVQRNQPTSRHTQGHQKTGRIELIR
jgi:hypothetical protein